MQTGSLKVPWVTPNRQGSFGPEGACDVWGHQHRSFGELAQSVNRAELPVPASPVQRCERVAAGPFSLFTPCLECPECPEGALRASGGRLRSSAAGKCGELRLPTHVGGGPPGRRVGPSVSGLSSPWPVGTWRRCRPWLVQIETCAGQTEQLRREPCSLLLVVLVCEFHLCSSFQKPLWAISHSALGKVRYMTYVPCMPDVLIPF